jgi:hypothetical protein
VLFGPGQATPTYGARTTPSPSDTALSNTLNGTIGLNYGPE